MSAKPYLMIFGILLPSACDAPAGQREVKPAIPKVDCPTIAPRLARCREVILNTVDEAERRTHNPMLVPLAAATLDSVRTEKRCAAHLKQRVRFLEKDCRKYGGTAVETCRKAQAQHRTALQMLTDCTAEEDCQKIARCFVQRLPTEEP